uniref:Ycf54 n=1 Tax=Spyridia filamentosa TaxID=196632 RepID=A0A1Z1MK37_SPYFI|nr:hypothetical protein [Spyridia filamentosa]ARW66114.1 hypothetical protein [Spyridia filamentosa]
MYNYYFAVASQRFLLQEEPLEEILRERMDYYESINKDIDFWLVMNPQFIKNFNNNSINSQKFHQSYAAVVSLDKQFIQWLKLRISFVILGDFQSSSLFIPEY